MSPLDWVPYDGMPLLSASQAAECSEVSWAAVEAAKVARHAAMPDEATALRVMHEAWTRLKELGWRDAIYAPIGCPLDVIEVGSTGIHRAERDNQRRFWIHDGDSWPSSPCLYRPATSRDTTPVSAPPNAW